MCFLSDVLECVPEPREEKRRGGPQGPHRHNIALAEYGSRFGVSLRGVKRVGLDRLGRCKDDEARRLLLRAGDKDAALAGEYGGALIADLYRKV